MLVIEAQIFHSICGEIRIHNARKTNKKHVIHRNTSTDAAAMTAKVRCSSSRPVRDSLTNDARLCGFVCVAAFALGVTEPTAIAFSIAISPALQYLELQICINCNRMLSISACRDYTRIKYSALFCMCFQILSLEGNVHNLHNLHTHIHSPAGM